jgi:hypothetical protein
VLGTREHKDERIACKRVFSHGCSRVVSRITPGRRSAPNPDMCDKAMKNEPRDRQQRVVCSTERYPRVVSVQAQPTGNAHELNYNGEVDPIWVRLVYDNETAYLRGVGVLELPPARNRIIRSQL